MALRLAKPPKVTIGSPDVYALVDDLDAWGLATFRVPSGISKGEPFHLNPFQKRLVVALLSRDPDGPTFRTLIYSLPRKLGKTYLLAFILLAFICPDSPIYKKGCVGAVAAPTEKHAGFLADAMRALLETAGREDDLRRRSDPRPGLLEMGDCVIYLSTGSNWGGHGLGLDFAVIDECGLIAKNQDELITGYYDALSSRDGQLLMTGTRGDNAIFNAAIDNPDPRTHVVLYGADKTDDPSDPKTWAKANPDGGKIKPPRFLKDAHDKALHSGSLTEFCVWHLNMPISPTRQLLLDYQTLAKSYRSSVTIEPGEPVHIGIDLGGSASMTAATIAYENSGVIKVMGAFPCADLDLMQRGKRDLVGDLWHRCAVQGELIETSGSVSDLQEFLPELIDRIGNHPVASVSCDRYRQHEFETALARAKLSWPVIYRGTGPKDGDADIRATRRLFLAGAVTMKRSILLEGSLGEADVKVSTTGATQLDKSHIHARIDVAQSLCLACSALLRARDAVHPEYEIEVI